MLSDIYLIDEIKNGNSDAFGILADRYNYIISRNLTKLYPDTEMNKGRDRDREDLFQECRIILYKAAKYYDAVKNVKFSTYANACVKNYLISLRRKYGRTKIHDLVPLDELRGSESGICDRYFAVDDIYSFLDFLETPGTPGTFLSALSAFERKVLMMYIENRSYKYMARILNKNVKSIDNAVCRIKSKLRPYAEYFVSEY